MTMTDRELQEHVPNALDWELSIDAADISVSVESGNPSEEPADPFASEGQRVR
jgi:hypothetical protein